MQQVNHSELRHRILSSLKLAPAESVTAIAQRLDVLRPSVSRAVKSLEDAGLVTRSGRRITLSLSGQAELLRLDDTLATKVLKDAEAATRVFGKGFGSVQDLDALTNLRGFGAVQDLNVLTRQFDEAAKSIGAYVDSSALRAFEGLSRLTSSVETSWQTLTAVSDSAASQVAEWMKNDPAVKLIESMKNDPVLKIAESIRESTAFLATDAFMGTAAVQATNLDLFQGWKVAVPSPLSDLISANNLALGTMVSDLEAFTKVGAVADVSLGELVNQTLFTAKVYDGYFVDAVKSVNAATSLDDVKVSVALPTQSVASLVGTTRSIVEAEIGIHAEKESMQLAQIRPLVYSRRYQVTKSRLEIYLEPLGPRFVNKWRGAWQTFYSDSQDRHSQATHSGRELLMQVLDYLAPDNVFTAEELALHGVKKPTRKMRVEHILKGNYSSSAELTSNIADSLESMYRVLVGETHRRDDKDHLDDTIAGMLGTLENLLFMLLSMHKKLS